MLLVFILFVAIKPGDNPVLLMRIASISAVIIFIGMIIYTRFLWRMIPFINLHKVIDIGGKWQGKMIFENGEILFPVREMNISGNIVSLWNSVTNIGTDYRECSRWRIPSLSFENIDLSGM